jgi:hypothetical protein
MLDGAPHSYVDLEDLTYPELAAWTGDAAVLTDDYAPVDQLLTLYPSG